MVSTPRDRCPVCNTSLESPWSFENALYCTCPRCGIYGLTLGAERALGDLLTTPRKVAVLSYGIHKTPKPKWPGAPTRVFDADECKKLVDLDELPTPQEQADNLVRWLGEHSDGPGTSLKPPPPSTVDVVSVDDLRFLIEGLQVKDVLAGRDLNQLRLTFKGWERFEELRRGAPSGRNAFMAMPFGIPELDVIVANHFKPAVKLTGFTLKRVDEQPEAGLIDARMMVQIKAAWFVVADLTHGNNGAYWEAGYATGLNKPVIYTCEESAWEKQKTHFDTNHHRHVLWDAANIASALEQLKAIIRITIPEATQQDEQ